MKTATARLQKISTDVLFSEWATDVRAAVLSAVGRVAPMPTIDYLISKFASPSKFPSAPPEIEALKSAHPFKISFEGKELQAWSWGDGPTILLVHGWSGRASQFFRFVPKLLKVGYSVVMFDAPAHGQSSGTQTNYPEYARAIREVADRVEAAGLVAHSFGSLTSAFAHRQGMQPIPSVFLSAPSNPTHYFDLFCARVGVRGLLKKRFADEIARRLSFDWKDLIVSDFASTLEAPLLVVQDPADKSVPWHHAVDVSAKWPGARLRSAPGLGHYRILRDQKVIDDAVEFLNSHIAGRERHHELGKAENS